MLISIKIKNYHLLGAKVVNVLGVAVQCTLTVSSTNSKVSRAALFFLTMLKGVVPNAAKSREMRDHRARNKTGRNCRVHTLSLVVSLNSRIVA